MIAQWMMYCVAVGVLLSACAAALDAALRPLRRPTRWVWIAALVLTLAGPAAVRAFGFLPRPAPTLPPAAAPQWTAGKRPKGAAPVTRTPPRSARPALPELPAVIGTGRLERPLTALWIASSALSALALAGLAGALARRRRGWAPAEVDGVPVLVSADVGPAVVGLLRGRIVLPQWVVDGDAESRALVMEHEREHLRAGDPRLLAGALALAVLTPWNPAVWWQLRRLRLAVEADCDARVLRRRGDVRAYGSVLLEVGRRASRSRLAAAAAFAEPVSTLERRIRIMTAPRARRPLLRAAGLGALAAALAIAACEAPAPTQARPASAPRASGTADDRAALRTYFPEVARDGMGADDVLLFVVSADGRVVRHRRVSGSGVALPVAMRAMLGDERPQSMRMVRLSAGEVAPTAVEMVWYRLRGPGDDPSIFTMVRDVPAGSDRPGPMRSITLTTPGAQASVMVEGTASEAATPDVPALRATLARYARAAGPTIADPASAEVSFTVGADGRARDLKIRAKPDAMEPVARDIAAALRFPAGAANHQGEMMLRLRPDPPLIPGKR